jgi:hypothetical protein
MGNIDRLPKLFAELDRPNRSCSLVAAKLHCASESGWLINGDRRLVRMQEMNQRIQAAAMS